MCFLFNKLSVEAFYLNVNAVTLLEEGLVGDIYAASGRCVVDAVFDGAAP
jgi:hypothetical protein